MTKCPSRNSEVRLDRQQERPAGIRPSISNDLADATAPVLHLGLNDQSLGDDRSSFDDASRRLNPTMLPKSRFHSASVGRGYAARTAAAKRGKHASLREILESQATLCARRGVRPAQLQRLQGRVGQLPTPPLGAQIWTGQVQDEEASPGLQLQRGSGGSQLSEHRQPDCSCGSWWRSRLLTVAPPDIAPPHERQDPTFTDTCCRCVPAWDGRQRSTPDGEGPDGGGSRHGDPCSAQYEIARKGRSCPRSHEQPVR